MAAEPKQQLLLRAVNARIREISDRFGTPEGTYRLICECGQEDCRGRVEVEVLRYDEARRRRGFFLAAGHAAPSRQALPGLLAAEPVPFQQAGGGTRTHGLPITNRMLYQLSYSGAGQS
jgi:hypothetical protein